MGLLIYELLRVGVAVFLKRHFSLYFPINGFGGSREKLGVRRVARRGCEVIELDRRY